MTDATDLLQPFDVAAAAAQQRETEFVRECERKIATLQRERAWAWRRRNLIAAMLHDDAPDDREPAIESMLVSAFRFMERIESSLDELDDAGRETCEALRAVAAALHDLTHVPDGSPGVDLGHLMGSFEAWHVNHFGVAFWEQLDRPVGFAPVVDF